MRCEEGRCPRSCPFSSGWICVPKVCGNGYPHYRSDCETASTKLGTERTVILACGFSQHRGNLLPLTAASPSGQHLPPHPLPCRNNSYNKTKRLAARVKPYNKTKYLAGLYNKTKELYSLFPGFVPGIRTLFSLVDPLESVVYGVIFRLIHCYQGFGVYRIQ